jgi:hypothetical protein
LPNRPRSGQQRIAPGFSRGTPRCAINQPAEDLKDPQRSVPNDPKMKCTVSDYKIDGKTASWSLECPQQKVTGTGQITYAEDSYTGSMKMKMGDHEMSTKYSGKWMGECTK